jgi:ferritin
MNLKGFANWFTVQAKEELDHAMGFFNYLLSRGGKVELLEIPKPPSVFKNPKSLFNEALKHEQFITGKINLLYELSCEEKDYSFQSFLKWYIDEQVEEESNATEMIEKMRMVGENEATLLFIDSQLATRVYTPTLPTTK